MFVFSIAVGVLIAGIVLVAVVISLCATEHAFTGRINLFDRNSLLWMNAVPVIFFLPILINGFVKK
jgi:hypothetical protein